VATPDLSFPDAWGESMRRSQARRAAAIRRRRVKRGGRSGLAVVFGALALAASVAIAQEDPAAPGDVPEPAAAIEPGDDGKDVRKLQRALGIRVDGEYGARTRRAVKRYQRRNDLRADGVAGPETLERLGIAAAAPDEESSGAPAGVSGERLAAIRECESGDDYAANTGNGFYGAYQFTQETWEHMGGTGAPHEAPPAEQDRIAAKVLQQQGPQAWPNCT
jgi:peptidoglycan hydrolase-like protein with peptidoglycan-binding domain